ncbi:GNAT family N-acetyltransferase [Chitinimonas koreensis]|uniref:GNAT family N-acetyltransferase n=1 Tax=Chitinimonas koreensis TaxID=356302 RepID=UPI0003F99948|nr:GNAT family N-acetyltransferase [Chitinimonas koreensis]QNM96035.1 hypothetical protein H9L41_19795 [Chitinimonas koreensis]
MPNQLEIRPYDPATAPALQALRDRLLAPHLEPGLADELGDAARGHGAQVRVAWRGGEPVGCVGWVLIGVEQDGCAYGSPLHAADQAAAAALIDVVKDAARTAGARELRITARRAETAKHAALAAAGFGVAFEFVWFGLAAPLQGSVDLPEGLREVPIAAVDWPRLHACYAECFRGVPNAPVPELAQMREEWSTADWQAGRVLADAAGDYQAFSLIERGEVDAVGVRLGWRGRGVADVLYRIADRSLASRGLPPLRALVAGSNAASLRFHRKLGFAEVAPRWTTYALALAG